MKKPSITSVQLVLMSVGSALIFPYTFMPILRTPPGNQDVWIVLLLMIPYVALINLPVLILINRFRGVSFPEMLEMILGKVFGKTAAVFFLLFFVFCLTACSLITLKFFTLYVFQKTPPWALLLFTLIPVAYAAWNGAGTVARLATFIVPMMMIAATFFFLMGIREMDFSELKPVLADSTFIELNQGAFLTGARYSEIPIFFVFGFYLHKKAGINKTYAAALIAFGVSFMIILLPTVLTLGVEYAQHAWNPYWEFSKQVEAYDFIQKVQSINLLAWFPGAMLKLALYAFMGSYTLSEIFQTKSHKGFVIPLVVLAFIVCLLPMVNRSDVIELLRSDQVFPYIVLPVTLMLPFILLIVYLIRRKKIDAQVKQKRMAAEAQAQNRPESSP